MFLQRGFRRVARQQRHYPVRPLDRVFLGVASRTRGPTLSIHLAEVKAHRRGLGARGFHSTRALWVVKPVMLADIGEGIVECEIIQWFVEPGARVEEFSPLCEVQSDKASVEITSRFAGVVTRLHYEAGEMAKVGKPFIDIDIQGGVRKEDLGALVPPEPAPQKGPSEPGATVTPSRIEDQPPQTASGEEIPTVAHPRGKHAALATPAVRHLSKERDVDITQITGSGKDGRVLKEDIYKFIASRDLASTSGQSRGPGGVTTGGATPTANLFAPPACATGPQQETRVQMNKTQEMMFKTMTRSLAIPHFLYADEIDFTELVELRGRLNKVLAKSTDTSPPTTDGSQATVGKLSYLPFIIKAVSLALHQYPVLNARVEVESSDGNKPTLVLRSQHNIGVAMDTSQGLVVPVVKNVGALNIVGIASELTRLQALAHAGRLSPADMTGGTITVSNIGNIGGTYLSPVVVEREVAILGVGRMRTVPAFASPNSNEVVRRHVCNFSWSADHRVVDGATLARAADVVRAIVEEPDVMVMRLR